MTEFKDLIKNDSIYFEYDVKDFEGAKKFYSEIFGFEITWDGGTEVGWCQMNLPIPGVKLGLNLLREGEVKQGSGLLYLDTGNVEAVETYLKEKGVKTDPIRDIPNMVTILIAYDPEGNRIGFVAEPRIKTE